MCSGPEPSQVNAQGYLLPRLKDADKQVNMDDFISQTQTHLQESVSRLGFYAYPSGYMQYLRIKIEDRKIVRKYFSLYAEAVEMCLTEFLFQSYNMVQLYLSFWNECPK